MLKEAQIDHKEIAMKLTLKQRKLDLFEKLWKTRDNDEEELQRLIQQIRRSRCDICQLPYTSAVSLSCHWNDVGKEA